MPAAPTVIDDVFALDAGGGRGTGVPAGGGDDGPRGSGSSASSRRYFTGISLGLAAILMFFMALTSAYIVRKGFGGDWQALRLPPILFLNTVVLLASSLTMEVARRRAGGAQLDSFRRWWWVTTILGVAFLAGQVIAWRQLAAAGIFLPTNPASSFFYTLTAAHGAHLAGGILALFYVAFRAWERAKITRAAAAEIASIYWHFMDGLWIFLLLLLYLGR
jgi:cytochrome c oxidase subunit 3